MKTLTINIRKPIWSGDKICEVGVRDTKIWKAKREKKDLRIVVPQGEVVMSVKEFLRGAVERPFVGRFPDRPMRFFYKKIYLDKKYPIEDVTIPFDVKDRMRERWIEKYG